MSTLEIKQELHQFIEDGDDQFVRMFYEMAKAYVVQGKKDRMITEGEEDVSHGRTYSLEEARKMVKGQ